MFLVEHAAAASNINPLGHGSTPQQRRVCVAVASRTHANMPIDPMGIRALSTTSVVLNGHSLMQLGRVFDPSRGSHSPAIVTHALFQMW